MKTDIPKILDLLMEKLALKQAGLAKRLGGGITQPQISRWMKGQDPERPNYDRIMTLARKAGVLDDVRSEDVAHALGDGVLQRKVKLKGYVGAGSEAHFYNLADEDYEEVEAPVGASDQTVAVEIKGKSFGPLLDTWLVYYDDVRSPITSDLYGHVCVVGLTDDRILIKKILPNKDGTFNLLSNGTEDPIESVQIEWAAKVIDLKPRS